MPRSKLNKGLLKKAKKAAREAGNELPSNKREIRNAAREVKRAVRENKEERTKLTWNLEVGDLVEISKHPEIKIGCITSIETGSAKSIKDYGQYVTILTKIGSIDVHPRYTKVIQKA